MDFTKYMSFLESRSLFFCRSDKLEDPYEGSTSHANERLRSRFYGDGQIPPEAFQQLSHLSEWIRQWTFINCWHMNEHESAAMWKLYVRTEEAIAIRSTYQKLHDCLPAGCHLGTVNHIDYESDWLPEGNSSWPFVHKRESFEHERELRAVIQDLPMKEKSIRVGHLNVEAGRLVAVEIEALVEGVYVSPTAPGWFTDLVSRATARYGYGFSVTQSILAKKPVFEEHLTK